jgi:hypothetical protein
LFAFEYSETFPENGWTVHEPIAELKRMVNVYISLDFEEDYVVCKIHFANIISIFVNGFCKQGMCRSIFAHNHVTTLLLGVESFLRS